MDSVRVMLLLVAAFASFMPALRVNAIDPMEALRTE
jgi:ABC-type lipoprotein release transport system permease subunit